MSPDELTRCADTLRKLVADAEVFLDKRGPDFAKLSVIRREANRLIEAVKGRVRAKRGQLPDRTANPNPAPATVITPEKPAARRSVTEHSGICYSCGQSIEQIHHHYRWMCQACGDWNWQKREQRTDLSGKAALVTGGRVRIGFQTCLKLLRAGATVHAVTRFPNDAMDRYSRELDFAVWRDRLTIHELDLCNLPAVERFAARLASGPLDILINNAAQTIRPPSEFFAHMLSGEARLAKELAPAVLDRVAPRERSEVHELANGRLTASAADTVQLAAGGFLDRRATNSWMARIGDVAPVELLEVNFINALAPFLLIQNLLPAMRSSLSQRRFIVNLAAREGQFAGKTSPRHPHTNMAKAALNMLTRSLAADLRRQGIYINSVDPGWVSDQRPFPRAEQSRAEAGDWLPLDDVDAAARVLDPVFAGAISSELPPAGKLWRNYQECEW